MFTRASIIMLLLALCLAGSRVSAQASLESRIVFPSQINRVAPRSDRAGDTFDAFVLMEQIAIKSRATAYGLSTSLTGGVDVHGDAFEGTYNPESGQIFLHESESAAQLRRDRMNRSTVVREESLLQDANSVMQSCGALRSEMTIDVDILAAADRENDGTVSAPRRIAYKVTVQRIFGGVPVFGDRLIFSYDVSSAQLYSVAGRWRSLNPTFDARWATNDGCRSPVQRGNDDGRC